MAKHAGCDLAALLESVCVENAPAPITEVLRLELLDRNAFHCFKGFTNKGVVVIERHGCAAVRSTSLTQIKGGSLHRGISTRCRFAMLVKRSSAHRSTAWLRVKSRIMS
jgi:predicted nuclease with RNAse H fold